MMHENGYGAVFVKVFDARGVEITPPKITHFRYMHSEKADDGSTIVIESLDPNLPDHPALQEHRKIQLLWGYMGGKQSGKRLVYIFDSNASFDEQGVRLELKCYDRLTYLKMTSNTTIYQGNADDIAGKIADDNGLNLITEEETRTVYPEIRTEKPSILQGNGLTAVATDNTAVVIPMLIIPQANKSEYKVLKEVVDSKPGGPWVMEGRDDDLIIRKRNFDQSPMRTYIYKDEPGYLLRFQPETKNKTHRAGAANVQVSGWNPEMKSYIMGDIGQVHDQDTVLGEYVEGTRRTDKPDNSSDDSYVDEEVTSEEDNELLGESEGDPYQEENLSSGEMDDLEANFKGLDDDARKALSQTAVGTEWVGYKLNNESPAILKADGTKTAAIDNTAVIVKREYYLKPDLNARLHTVEQDEAGISAEGLNKRKEEELEKNPASGTVVGDPELESGKIITILNVSKKHSGNYYLTQTEHVVDFAQGYLVNFQAVRNGDNITGLGKKKAKSYKKKVNKQIGKAESVELKSTTVTEVYIDENSGAELPIDPRLLKTTLKGTPSINPNSKLFQ